MGAITLCPKKESKALGQILETLSLHFGLTSLTYFTVSSSNIVGYPPLVGIICKLPDYPFFLGPVKYHLIQKLWPSHQWKPLSSDFCSPWVLYPQIGKCFRGYIIYLPRQGVLFEDKDYFHAAFLFDIFYNSFLGPNTVPWYLWSGIPSFYSIREFTLCCYIILIHWSVINLLQRSC